MLDLARVRDDEILVLVEEEGTRIAPCTYLFVHEFQGVVYHLIGNPDNMVQFSSTQPFQTLTIPLLECGIALLLIILEAERVRPVRLAPLADLFVSERQRAVGLGGREEL